MSPSNLVKGCQLPVLTLSCSGSISAGNQLHTSLIFLIKSAASTFFLLQQKVVYTDRLLWESHELLTRCLWHFSIFYFRACLCILFVCLCCCMFDYNTHLYFCTLHWLSVWCEVCAVLFFYYYYFKSKGNEIQCWMNYGVCILTYRVLFRVCEWTEFMCERSRNKNREIAACCRHSARYCMNCLLLLLQDWYC